MKRLSLVAILMMLFFYSSGQTKNNNIFLKLSGGSVSFGSGDFMGYSFAFEASKNIVKKPAFALSKFLIGGELIFENGVKNPVIQNPTQDDFLFTFHHVSSTILWGKASYYPFNKIIKGFNVAVGPTIGYSFRSGESGAKRVTDITGQTTRQSTLAYDNGFAVGYRISTGVEFNINKKLLTGFRLDFSNNNKAEINTLAAIKIGFRL